MELGLFMPPFHAPGGYTDSNFENDIFAVQIAEEHGLNEVLIGEHYIDSWQYCPSPEFFLGAAHHVTSHIRLGTGVYVLPYADPIQLAHRMSYMAEIVRPERFVLGLGAGSTPADHQLFHVDYDDGERRVIAQDNLERFIAELEGASLTEPEIAIAGDSWASESLKLAGEHGFSPMSRTNYISILESHWQVYSEVSILNGHIPDYHKWRIVIDVVLGKSRHEAQFTPVAHFHQQNDGGHNFPNGRLHFVGSPESVANDLKRLHHQLGGFGVALVNWHDWGNDAVQQMDLLANLKILLEGV